jgi:hypothetical protein
MFEPINPAQPVTNQMYWVDNKCVFFSLNFEIFITKALSQNVLLEGYFLSHISHEVLGKVLLT